MSANETSIFVSSRCSNCLSVSTQWSLLRFTLFVVILPRLPLHWIMLNISFFSLLLFIFYLLSLSPSSTAWFVVLEGKEREKYTVLKKQLDWISSLLHSFWVKNKHNNDNQELFLDTLRSTIEWVWKVHKQRLWKASHRRIILVEWSCCSFLTSSSYSFFKNNSTSTFQ